MATGGGNGDTPRKTCMSEPSKRKRRTTRESDDSEEEQIYHLVQFICDNSFSIVKDENLRYVSEQDKKVRARHLGKWYDAELLKSGTHEYILRKAKYYQHGFDMETHNEEESNKRLKGCVLIITF
jgi:hypothetical protein